MSAVMDVRRDGVRRVAQVVLDDRGVGAGSRQEARRGEPEGVGDAAETGALRKTSMRRRTLRGSSGVPISVVKTRPCSCHAPAAVRCSSSCRVRRPWSATVAARGSGTVLRDVSVGGSSSLSPRDSERASIGLSAARRRGRRPTSAGPAPHRGAARWPASPGTGFPVGRLRLHIDRDCRGRPLLSARHVAGAGAHGPLVSLLGLRGLAFRGPRRPGARRGAAPPTQRW